MKCGACQRDCRTTRLANVATPDGGMRRARVCGKCFDGALHIVTHVVTVKKGVDETTARRREASEVVKAAANKIARLADAYEKTAKGDDEIEFQIAGLRQACEILDAGDF